MYANAVLIFNNNMLHIFIDMVGEISLRYRKKSRVQWFEG